LKSAISIKLSTLSCISGIATLLSYSSNYGKRLWSYCYESEGETIWLVFPQCMPLWMLVRILLSFFWGMFSWSRYAFRKYSRCAGIPVSNNSMFSLVYPLLSVRNSLNISLFSSARFFIVLKKFKNALLVSMLKVSLLILTGFTFLSFSRF